MSITVGDALVLKHPYRDVTAVAIATQQTLVATGTQAGQIHLWESCEGEELILLTDAHKADRINALDFNSDGTILASAGEDGRLVLWDVANISSSVRFRYLEGHGHHVAITCCAFSKASMLLCTGGKDGDVMLWGNLGRPVCGRLRGHRNWITCCAFSTDGAFVATGGYDHVVCLWNTSTFAIVQSIRRHNSPVSCIAVSLDGSVLVSGDDSGLVLVSRKDGTILRQLVGHQDSISGIVLLHSSGSVLTTSYDWSLKLWTLKGQCLSSRKAHHGRVLGFAVSDEEDFYVTTSDDFTAKIVPFVWQEPKRLQPDDVAEVEQSSDGSDDDRK